MKELQLVIYIYFEICFVIFATILAITCKRFLRSKCRVSFSRDSTLPTSL